MGLISLDTKENKTPFFCVLIVFKASEIDASVYFILIFFTYIFPNKNVCDKIIQSKIVAFIRQQFKRTSSISQVVLVTSLEI